MASPLIAVELTKVTILLSAPLVVALTPPTASSHATPLPVEVKTCPSLPCDPPTVILSSSAVPSTSKSVPTNSFFAILAPPSTLNIPVSPEPSEESVVPVRSTIPVNVADKSSLIVSAVACEFRELPDPPAFAVWNIMSPPAPEPLPCPP